MDIACNVLFYFFFRKEMRFMENEQKENVMIIYAKGEDRMKMRFVDAIKMGIGIYVGYNLAQKLIGSIKIDINHKK